MRKYGADNHDPQASDAVPQLNRQYFSGRLSPSVLAHLTALNGQREEVITFVRRLFSNFQSAQIPAEDFPVSLARLIKTQLPNLLPGAWQEMVPPVTAHGRHILIDRYLANNSWSRFGDQATFLELGCGFPPVTTLETAERFEGWRVVGLDRAFWPYLVTDENGDYACFDSDLTIRFFQPSRPGPVTWEALFADRKATTERFESILRELLPGLSSVDGEEFAETRAGGHSLRRNPIRHFESPRVRFVQEDLLQPGLENVDVARCFNVLIYFDRAFRQRLLGALARTLKPNGLFLCGYDWVKSRSARYTVYRNENGSLVPKEFAFSLDNLCPFSLSWYVMHDDEEELNRLVTLIAALRSDSVFMSAFTAKSESLRAATGICPRDADGFLGDLPAGVSQLDLDQRIDGFVEGLVSQTGMAVEALARAGYIAWENEAGHLAVTPWDLPAGSERVATL